MDMNPSGGAAMTAVTQHRFDPAPAVAGCLLFALILFLPQILNDGDTLWQITTGNWILDHRAIPHTDPFSFTAGDRRWFAHEWLAEVLLALAHRAGGMAGVMVLAAAATGLTGGLLLRHLRRFLPAIYAVLFLILALGNAAPSMLARPHLLAWPCLELWVACLVIARARGTAPSLWLLPVMAVWVNLHGSFMLGLLLPAAFLIEAMLDAGADFRRPLRPWLIFIAASWVVALLNPDFLAGVLFPIGMIGMKSLAWIGEWQPTDFGQLQPLELLILGGLALGLSGTLKLPPIRLLLLLGLVHGALRHARNEQLIGIVGVLILAEPVGRQLARPVAEALGVAWRRLAVGGVVLALAALTARLTLPLDRERTGDSFAAVLDRVPTALRARPVLNDYGHGGHLIFHGVRPFIDSRADLYGDAFLTRYRAIDAAEPDALARVLSEYAIAWTIFPEAHKVPAALDRMPGWRRIAVTGGMVVQAREEGTGR